MTKPLEKERKFVVHKSVVPRGAAVTEIIQDYLVSPDPRTEQRVRQSTPRGASATYTFTVKGETKKKGERTEVEKEITAGKYDRLLRERDPETQTIRKLRRTFVFGENTFQKDTYLAIIWWVEMVEVEVEDMSAPINFPPGWQVTEVTGDKRFSNRSIAEGKFPLDEVRNMTTP